jgi:hypothetical protein
MRLDQHSPSEEAREMVTMQLITMQLSTRGQSCPNCLRFFDQNQEGCRVPNNVCMRCVVMDLLLDVVVNSVTLYDSALMWSC